MFEIIINGQGALADTSKKVKNIKVLCKATDYIRNEIAYNKNTKPLVELVSFLDNYTTKFPDRAMMENLLVVKDIDTEVIAFLIERKPEILINEGTLMERKLTVVGMFLVSLGISLSKTLTVNQYRQVEKTICKTISTLLKKNLVGKKIPKRAELVGYGMMKLVFKSEDKVYKYYYNKSINGLDELKIEPYVISLLSTHIPDFVAKVSEFDGNVSVQEYVDGPRLDEVLGGSNISEGQIINIASDVFFILKSIQMHKLNINDLGALNFVYDNKTFSIRLVDIDGVIEGESLSLETYNECLIDSLVYLKHGKSFSSHLNLLMKSSGMYDELVSYDNEPDLVNVTDFLDSSKYIYSDKLGIKN